MKCKQPVCPQFCINDEAIENVSEWLHLGNLISVALNDSAAVSARRINFIGQANDVLGFFAKLDPIIKMTCFLNIVRVFMVRLCGTFNVLKYLIYAQHGDQHYDAFGIYLLIVTNYLFLLSLAEGLYSMNFV